LDTVTDSLDCFFVYLARHPEQRRLLIEQPDIVPSAIEELLRWETPVPGVVRIALQDVEVGGCPISKGERVSPLLGAANTDPDEFADPDVVDFARSPNRHRAFGGGPHRCLGSHLARLELRVALREFHRRIPDYEIPSGTELKYTSALRSVESLPLRFPAATS
jgi:cytochrome P450